MSFLFTVAGDKPAKPVALDDLAEKLRKKIPPKESGKPQLAKQPLTLPSQVGVVEALLVVRGHEDPHTHPERDLIFSVLEGGGFVQLSGGRIEAPAGATVLVPKGVCHAFHNNSPSDSVLLATFSPGTFSPSKPDPGKCAKS
jgi:quercetin dioxygenase-like cupin family protein